MTAIGVPYIMDLAHTDACPNLSYDLRWFVLLFCAANEHSPLYYMFSLRKFKGELESSDLPAIWNKDSSYWVNQLMI